MVAKINKFITHADIEELSYYITDALMQDEKLKKLLIKVAVILRNGQKKEKENEKVK